MFFDDLDLLNKYDSNKKVILITLSSLEMSEFNIYYQYVVKRINELDSNELKESFSSSLKYLFNRLKTTIQPYEEVLQGFDLNGLGIFFSQLVDADYEEMTSQNIQKLANLIKKFIKGEVSNELYKKYIEYHRIHGGSSVVVSYHPENNKEINYSSVYKYFGGNTFYENAFFLGTPNYYGGTTIFKAKRTFYLGYDMYRMDFRTEDILKDNVDGNSSIYRDVEIVFLSDDKKKHTEIMTVEDKFEHSIFTIDLKKLKRKYTIDIDYKISCEANLVAFSSAHYMFYTTKSKLNIVNKESGLVIKKELNKVNELDWIIIRTASDEEYLKEESKREIGEIYDYYYSEVTKYKEILREKIENEYFTLEKLNQKLSTENIRVTTSLLKQWVYGDTIAPQRKNYYKLLRLLDYSEQEIENNYEYYRIIISARNRAGRKLSNIFQAIVDRIGIDKISKKMYEQVGFEFSDNFGEFRIEQIEYIDNEIANIEMSDLYKIRAIGNVDKEKDSNGYFY